MEPTYIQHFVIHSLSMVRTTIKNMVSFLETHFVLDVENEYRIRLILNELISNGYIHGNRMQEDKLVHIYMKVGCPGRVTFLIIDEGDGFDYRSKLKCCEENETVDLDCLLEGGRGLKLVKSMSDVLMFNRKGNKVLVKISL
ncbi:MAG: ATP-binding protein [Clostridia bacterium]